MIKVENEWMFYALALLPMLFVVFYLNKRWSNKRIASIAQAAYVQSLFPDKSPFRIALKFWIYLFAVALLVIAMINPQIGSKLAEAKQEGIDIMICLDVSNSMKAEDIYPNRLEKAKQAIWNLIGKLKGDRIGMVVFAGESYVQLPITSDYGAAKLFLDNIETELIPVQGTAIGSAISLAMESFGLSNENNKAIIVISDGENHEDDAVAEAKNALSKNCKVYTVGMGSVEGAPIPVFIEKKHIGFKKDNSGQTVVTKLNENMLKEVAIAGGGSFVRANNAEAGLNIILNEINKIARKEYGSKRFVDYEDRFQWFLFPAIVLLLIELLIPSRKSGLFKNLNLFSDKKS